MSDYIEKEDAIQSIIAHDLVGGNSRGWAEYLLENTTTADVAPVRHGRWEPYSIEPEAYDIAGVKSWAKKYRCSECRFLHTVIEDFGIYTFCPNCGAKMDGEDDEID